MKLFQLYTKNIPNYTHLSSHKIDGWIFSAENNIEEEFGNARSDYKSDHYFNTLKFWITGRNIKRGWFN